MQTLAVWRLCGSAGMCERGHFTLHSCLNEYIYYDIAIEYRYSVKLGSGKTLTSKHGA